MSEETINADMGAGRQRTVPVELPPNSYASKRIPPAETAPEARVKREKIVTGPVTLRKKSVPNRMLHTLFSGQTDSVSSYVVGQVLLPAAKNMLADTVGMIADALRQGMEQAIFGDTRPSRSASRPGYTNYSTSVTRPGPGPARQVYAERKMSVQQRASHDLDVIFKERGEAEDVLDQLQALIEAYKVATVADYYDFIGITNDFVDNKWGWSDLRGATILMVHGGHLLRLPKPIALD